MKKRAFEITEERGSTQPQRSVAKRMSAPVMLLAVALPTLVIGGCAKHSKDHFTVGTVKDDYRTRHPIVVSEQEKTLDIPIASSAYDVPVAIKGSIAEFAFQYKQQANGNIRIMLPGGSPNQTAAQRVSRKIVETIRESGVAGYRIQTVGYDASRHGASAPIRLSYAAISANVEKCGKWNKDLTDNVENHNYHNFGCATQGNLAAIVANPADLLGPRGATSIDATRRDVVIDAYRNGEETASNISINTPPGVFEN